MRSYKDHQTKGPNKMDNVIEIGDLLIEKLKNYRANDCRHLNVKIDPIGEIVTCKDCGANISAFYALEQLASYWQARQRKFESQKKELQELIGKTIHIKALKEVQRHWLGKTMAVCCPHCKRGILPEDGLGREIVSKELELKRRERQ